MVNDALIIRCNIVIHPEKMGKIREDILKQKETGVVVLPYYCDAIQVLKDMLIKFMDAQGNIYDLKEDKK